MEHKPDRTASATHLLAALAVFAAGSLPAGAQTACSAADCAPQWKVHKPGRSMALHTDRHGDTGWRIELLVMSNHYPYEVVGPHGAKPQPCFVLEGCMKAAEDAYRAQVKTAAARR